MRVTLSLPDPLAERFLALVPNRERSSTVARLLETELARRESELERACQVANADSVLSEEVAGWQSFDDPAPARGRRRSR
jgi:metal-responsive CopG/Arc/MetJ family transcriptional regulator